MKRKIMVLLAVITVFCLAACSGREQQVQSVQETQTEEQEVEEAPDVNEKNGGLETDVFSGTDTGEAEQGQDTEGHDGQQDVIPEFEYKFAVIKEEYDDTDSIYPAEIWCAIETPAGFNIPNTIRIFKDGMELDYPDISTETYKGYVCSDAGKDRFERGGDARIYTLKIEGKEKLSAKDLAFVADVEYFNPETMMETSTKQKYELSINAEVDDLGIGSSKYLYGNSLFKLDDETLLLMMGSGGISSGSMIDLGPTYSMDDETVQHICFMDQAVLLKGDADHACGLLEQNSKIYYLDPYNTEDKNLLDKEMPQPADEDMTLFVTSVYESYPKTVKILYGYMKKNCSPNEILDSEILYGTNIVYTAPDGSELWFIY